MRAEARARRATLAGLATGLSTTTNSRSAIALSATITLIIAWRLSASVALYWIASSGVGAVQALVLRRSPMVPELGR